jgi:hypothetical protein
VVSAPVRANGLIAPAQRRPAYFAVKFRLTGVVVTLAECRVSAHGSHDSVPAVNYLSNKNGSNYV